MLLQKEWLLWFKMPIFRLMLKLVRFIHFSKVTCFGVKFFKHFDGNSFTKATSNLKGEKITELFSFYPHRGYLSVQCWCCQTSNQKYVLSLLKKARNVRFAATAIFFLALIDNFDLLSIYKPKFQLHFKLVFEWGNKKWQNGITFFRSYFQLNIK